MRKVFAKEAVADELLKVAQLLSAAPSAPSTPSTSSSPAAPAKAEDPQFTKKIAELRSALPGIRSKKLMKLNRFGVSDALRPATTTVEQLVDLLLRVANSKAGSK